MFRVVWSSPDRAGKRGRLFSLLLKDDRLCNQEWCQLQAVSSPADEGSLGTQGEFLAVCILLCMCTLLVPMAPCPMSAYPLEDHSPFSAKTKAPRISEGLQKLDPERLVDMTLVSPFPLCMGEQLEPREIKDCLQCARSLCCITNSHNTVDADSTRLLAQFPWVRSLTLT